jgi:hypothetical protein
MRPSFFPLSGQQDALSSAAVVVASFVHTVRDEDADLLRRQSQIRRP